MSTKENGKSHQWRQAIKRALAHKYGSVEDGLEKLAEGVVELAAQGDQQCWKEIADRMDGKAVQSIATDEEPIRVVISEVQAKL